MATRQESWSFSGFGNKRDSLLWSRHRSSYPRRFTYTMIFLSNGLCRYEVYRNSHGNLTNFVSVSPIPQNTMTSSEGAFFFFFSVVTHYFNIETKKLKLLIIKNIMTVNVLVKYICHWLVLIFNFKYLHFRIFNGKYCQQHQSTSCCW